MTNENETSAQAFLQTLFNISKTLIKLGVTLIAFNRLPLASADGSSGQYDNDHQTWQQGLIGLGGFFIGVGILAGLCCTGICCSAICGWTAKQLHNQRGNRITSTPEEREGINRAPEDDTKSDGSNDDEENTPTPKRPGK